MRFSLPPTIQRMNITKNNLVIEEKHKTEREGGGGKETETVYL